MKPSQLRRNLIFACLILFVLSGVSQAGLMEITIDNASPTGLFFGPDPSVGDSFTYGFPNNFQNLSIYIRRVNGTLGGELTTVDGFLNLTFSGDLALMDAQGIQIGTLTITAAVLRQTANGFAEGSIDFLVAFGEGPGESYAGSWYLTAEGFGMQSKLWDTGFELFATGARKKTDVDQEDVRQHVRPTGGIDLQAGMVEVPEPPTLAYLAILLAGMAAAILWIRKSAATRRATTVSRHSEGVAETPKLTEPQPFRLR